MREKVAGPSLQLLSSHMFFRFDTFFIRSHILDISRPVDTQKVTQHFRL